MSVFLNRVAYFITYFENGITPFIRTFSRAHTHRIRDILCMFLSFILLFARFFSQPPPSLLWSKWFAVVIVISIWTDLLWMGHQVTSVGCHALVYMPRHDATMPIIRNMFGCSSASGTYLEIKSASLIMSFVMSLTLRLNKNFNACIKLAFVLCDYVRTHWYHTCRFRVRAYGILLK